MLLGVLLPTFQVSLPHMILQTDGKNNEFLRVSCVVVNRQLILEGGTSSMTENAA